MCAAANFISARMTMKKPSSRACRFISRAQQPIIDYYAKQHKLKKMNANVEAAEVRLAVAAMLK